MFEHVQGKKFLGFGKIQNCSNCNNEILTQIIGTYQAMNFLAIPSGFDFMGFYTMCPTCEQSKQIKGTHFWSKNEEKQKVCAELDLGKEYTKVWFKEKHEIKDSKGNYFSSRKEYIKSLNKCGAYSLVSFLTS